MCITMTAAVVTFLVIDLTGKSTTVAVHKKRKKQMCAMMMVAVSIPVINLTGKSTTVAVHKKNKKKTLLLSKNREEKKSDMLHDDSSGVCSSQIDGQNGHHLCPKKRKRKKQCIAQWRRRSQLSWLLI